MCCGRGGTFGALGSAVRGREESDPSDFIEVSGLRGILNSDELDDGMHEYVEVFSTVCGLDLPPPPPRRPSGLGSKSISLMDRIGVIGLFGTGGGVIVGHWEVCGRLAESDLFDFMGRNAGTGSVSLILTGGVNGLERPNNDVARRRNSFFFPFGSMGVSADELGWLDGSFGMGLVGVLAREPGRDDEFGPLDPNGGGWLEDVGVVVADLVPPTAFAIASKVLDRVLLPTLGPPPIFSPKSPAIEPRREDEDEDESVCLGGGGGV